MRQNNDNVISDAQTILELADKSGMNNAMQSIERVMSSKVTGDGEAPSLWDKAFLAESITSLPKLLK